MDRAAPRRPAGGGAERAGAFTLGEGHALDIAYLDAYPEGFELGIEASTPPSRGTTCLREGDDFGPDVFGGRWPMVGERSDVLIFPTVAEGGLRLLTARTGPT